MKRQEAWGEERSAGAAFYFKALQGRAGGAGEGGGIGLWQVEQGGHHPRQGR